jgi:hypothetical protein
MLLIAIFNIAQDCRAAISDVADWYPSVSRRRQEGSKAIIFAIRTLKENCSNLTMLETGSHATSVLHIWTLGWNSC